jgi:hypothetical protein
MDLGNVSITAPANGTVHLVLNGYAYMNKNNNTARLGLGSSPNSFGLGSHLAGVAYAGPVTERGYYSMTVQAVYNVTEGNTYTFYATAWRGTHNDWTYISLIDVRLTATFLAT